MSSIDKTSTKELITKSLQKSITYAEFRTLVTKLVAEKATTGTDQSADMVNYTMLNDRRMKRWEKTVKLTDEVKEKVRSYNRKTIWLVLTESWCGDAAHTMPIMNKIAMLNENIDLRVVLRDENLALMDSFLTNGSRSIPKLIAIDHQTHQVIGEFGPRPSTARKIAEDFKAQHGVLTPEFKQDLQLWYNKDKGKNTIDDLAKLL